MGSCKHVYLIYFSQFLFLSLPLLCLFCWQLPKIFFSILKCFSHNVCMFCCVRKVIIIPVVIFGINSVRRNSSGSTSIMCDHCFRTFICMMISKCCCNTSCFLCCCCWFFLYCVLSAMQFLFGFAFVMDFFLLLSLVFVAQKFIVLLDLSLLLFQYLLVVILC